MLASKLAAEGNIASAAHIASTAGVSTAPIVDSLIASGQYDAAVQLTMATNPMELGFVNQNIGLAKTAAETAAVATPVATSPLATMGAATPLTAAELAAADASAGLLGSSNALAPGAAATSVGVANALSPEALAAYDASVGLTAGGVPATLSPEALAAYDASVGLTAGTGAGAGAGAGAGLGTAANTLANVVSLGGEGIDASIGKAYADLGVGATGLPTDLLSSLAKLAKDYGVPLSALTSAITGSRAATDAANIQAESAREARALAEKIFNEQKALQEPYRAAGITAQNQLLNLLGLSGNTAAPEYGKFARPFGMSDFQQDPGYAFRLSEGMKALEASRAAQLGKSTGLLSGATFKALQRYGQEMGTQEYGNAFNRFQTERSNRLQPLSGLMTLGQAAASNQGAAAGAFGTTAGNLTTDIGAAQAAGGIGSANAITNAMNQLARYSAAQNLPDIIRQSVYAPAIR
jgi:hypothetical protein